MRDYKKNPLKFKEKISKEEIYDLYINKNYSRSMLQEYFNVGRTKIRQTLKFYNIEKPKNLRQQAYKNACIKKYGKEHPRKDENKNKQIIEKIKNTNLERYTTEFASQSIVIKEKTKQTLLNKYGTTAIQKIPEIKEKSKQTSLEHFGTQHPSQSNIVKNKQKQTNLEKYGVTCTLHNAEIQQKVKQTNLQRYGCENASQNEIIKQKIKNTNLEKYGVEWSLQNKQVREKAKQTLLNKYREDNYFKTDEFVVKSKQTCHEKYGYEFASQSPEFRQKVEQTNLKKYGCKCCLNNDKIKEKSKQTILEKYGVEHISKNQEIVKKQWEGKKKHGTTNTSKTEKYIKQKLLEIFKEVKTNYKCEKYPFYCDFYIPEKDLFIEDQGFEGHGKEPFDHTNPQHLTILKIWVEKAEKKPYNKSNKYLAYLKTWIKTDVLKRQIAKQNNLNWIEFFTVEQFDNWITKKDTSV